LEVKNSIVCGDGRDIGCGKPRQGLESNKKTKKTETKKRRGKKDAEGSGTSDYAKSSLCKGGKCKKEKNQVSQNWKETDQHHRKKGIGNA